MSNRTKPRTNVDTLSTALKEEEPLRYHVILLNDDFTPMEFVVEVLIKLFNKTFDEAQKITQQVHHDQRGIAGTFNKEIAFEKKAQVCIAAKRNEFPLNCIVEPAK